MEKKLYTISIFSENTVGLLSQVSLIFTRRGINIESISASVCSIPGVHKWTITAWATRDVLDKIAQQIEKCIDILKVFVYDDKDIVYQEVALYKVATTSLLDEPDVEQIIRRFGARILDVTREYTIIEKTGHYNETQALYEELKKHDLKQFVRSGRITVTKSPHEYVTEFISQQEKRRNRIENDGE